MINISIDNSQVRKLEKELGDKAKRLPRELATAVNATARKVRSSISRSVRQELAVTKKVVDKTIDIRGKATPKKLGSTIRLNQTKRIPLRDFGARQNRAGVSYRVSKSGGRQHIPGAFQGPRPGAVKASWRGRVFKRVGKERLPIVQLFGASPWGVFKKQKLTKPTNKEAKKELRKQVDRRIRFIKLKNSGSI